MSRSTSRFVPTLLALEARESPSSLEMQYLLPTLDSSDHLGLELTLSSKARHHGSAHDESRHGSEYVSAPIQVTSLGSPPDLPLLTQPVNHAGPPFEQTAGTWNGVGGVFVGSHSVQAPSTHAHGQATPPEVPTPVYAPPQPPVFVRVPVA
jgi:hypothetical protein